jgi:hypothetical protein
MMLDCYQAWFLNPTLHSYRILPTSQVHVSTILLLPITVTADFVKIGHVVQKLKHKVDPQIFLKNFRQVFSHIHFCLPCIK